MNEARNKYMRKWRSAHVDHLREYFRERREKNIDKILKAYFDYLDEYVD